MEIRQIQIDVHPLDQAHFECFFLSQLYHVEFVERVSHQNLHWQRITSQLFYNDNNEKERRHVDRIDNKGQQLSSQGFSNAVSFSNNWDVGEFIFKQWFSTLRSAFFFVLFCCGDGRCLVTRQLFWMSYNYCIVWFKITYFNIIIINCEFLIGYTDG